MRRVLGTDRVHFEVCSLTLNLLLAGPPAPAEDPTCDGQSPVIRSFDRLSDAAAENGESRVLVGIHFRHSVDDGLVHGKKIGKWAVGRFMEPVHH
jgi:hypothetical protein